MKNNYYAIIMAGGVGSRFWPISTQEFPKQFHDMLGSGYTLLQKTFNRLSKFIPKGQIYVLTNERYRDLVLCQLPEIRPKQVVEEPEMRNTAPCILYAALKIHKENPEALLLVAPSDHWIEDETAFANNILQGFRFCLQHDTLVTLGIKPTFPNTGFGYIEFNHSEKNKIHKVLQFREKPDYETAKSFLSQGNFLWNAGIFMWSTTSVIKAFKVHQSDLYNLFDSGIETYNTNSEEEFIRENYGKSENISVDYAILEPSNNVYVLPATFDWNDLGTWGSLYNKLEKDNMKNAIVNAKTYLENAKGNIITTTTNKIVVVDGISDYIIVDKEEILLIVPKSKEQDIKNISQRVNAIYNT